MCQAVTKAKLGYDPLEVNPEDMVRFAKEKPQVRAKVNGNNTFKVYQTGIILRMRILCHLHKETRCIKRSKIVP